MIKTVKIFSTFILLFIGVNVTAQSSDATDSSLMYVSGEGLLISLGKANKTKFNLQSTIQSGFNTFSFDSTNKTTKTNRLSLNLVRLSLTVSGLKDKIGLGIVTDFTSTTPILEGWASVKVFKENGTLFLGQRQTHTNNRLAMADERYWQVMGQTIAGRSNDGSTTGGLMQNFVGATREGGLFLETNFKLKKWVIYPSASITTGEGQNFFGIQNNVGFKYGGRLDIMPFGSFIKNGAYVAQDVYREQKPKLAFGVAASYNLKVSSAIGADNATITGIFNKAGEADFADYRKIVADLIFKHNGFAFVAEYVNTSVAGKELYTNIAATNKLTNDRASAFYNMGSSLNFQTSYVVKNGWGIDGRFTSITPEFYTQTSIVHKQNWYSFGLCKFINSNSVRFGLNATLIDDNDSKVNTKRWLGNLAVQILL
jgi:hypothetical protein